MDRITRFSYFVLLTILLSTAAKASPIETPPWSWRKGSFGISNTTEYFSSNANFGPLRGEFSRLTGDNSLTDFNSWVRGRYAFWPKFSAYGGIGLAQVRAVDAFSEKTNSGLTEAYLGGHFTVWRQFLAYFLRIEFESIVVVPI